MIEEVYSRVWYIGKEDLENMKEIVVKFDVRLSVEVRRQEKLDKVEKRDFRREELPEKYIAKILYRWDNRKFEIEYLKKLCNTHNL